MTASVSYFTHGQIGNIVIDSPPVNALSQHVRQGIVDALQTAAGDDTQIVVLRCEGRTFIAGADITEFGKPPQAPALAAVLEALESHPKPIIAAIHGTALGGGLELTLCCDYRVATTSAKVGLPEVNLGLLPGAGGTQRLPRLAGLAQAIDMITTGRPITARDALTARVVDEVCAGDLGEGATKFAEALIDQGEGKRLTRDIPLRMSDEDTALLSQTRDTIAKRLKGQTAPQRILDCLEAAGTLTFEEGLAAERRAFEACMEDPQSAALRHLFFAERAAGKIDGMAAGTKAQPVKHAGIIGAGTMGGGIAMCFAQSGFRVTLVDQDEDGLDRGLSIIKKNYEISIKRGRLSAEQVEGFLRNLEPTTDWQQLQDVDLVIEAVFENLELKQNVFQKLDEICAADTILASNTSYQSIDALAAATNRPDRVVGMHFFSPANVMRLLEVVRGEASSDITLATAMAVGKKIGKVCALSGMCYGFIGNRMLRHYGREAALCVMEGASPAQVDQAMERWGMAMGPMAVGDLAGLDIGYRAREQLSDEEKGPRVNYLLADRLVEAGRLGQKSGAGYYRYNPDTRAREEDPAVAEIITATRAELGITPRSVSEEEIVDRLTLALANEGARILEEGIAQRASDIDVVYCFGYGFPRFRGGPMHVAEARGLQSVVDTINRFHDTLAAENWVVAPLLARLATQGGSLADIGL
ncbi:MAG: 3-hydroxyacyl-CoA dehydrogenase [Halieaceae bacterium]|nr:3-hydroxyacyl-CoA dehydrogenase [Halieaceae bacterium]